MTELRELTPILEEKLRHLERLCNDEKNFTDVNITMYYTAAKNMIAAGYDARHHVASAYALIKRLNLNTNGR